MEASACYPGSLGELIQGNLRGKDILISCPINLYTNVKVFESNHPESKYKNKKTAKFLKNILKRWDFDKYNNTLDINIFSQIPTGKGFASSTADLCALYKALLKLFKRKYNQQELIEECIAIEPTDSIIFKEMTLFDYKYGSFYENIGSYVEFNLLVFEGTTMVDTIEFNKKLLPPHKDIGDLLPILKNGILERDIKKIGAAATESIKRNQHRLRYDFLEDILNISSKNGGLGVVGAHSGNCIGIIFDDIEKMKNLKEYNNLKNMFKIYALKTIEMI